MQVVVLAVCLVLGYGFYVQTRDFHTEVRLSPPAAARTLHTQQPLQPAQYHDACIAGRLSKAQKGAAGDWFCRCQQSKLYPQLKSLRNPKTVSAQPTAVAQEVIDYTTKRCKICCRTSRRRRKHCRSLLTPAAWQRWRWRPYPKLDLVCSMTFP